MKLSKDILHKLGAITNKRPATIIQHIIEHDYITTQEITELYGYEHPPRAVRDVRERGINLVTYRVKSSDGRTIAAYKFGEPIFIDNQLSKKAGRTALAQTIKKALIEKYGCRCFVYSLPMDERSLQIDHRIPFEIAGEQSNDPDCYMLLSPSANRAKSWTCEHCKNWSQKDIEMCKSCFWAHPEEYTHIAGFEERKIVITFTNNEIEDYNKLINLVGMENAEKQIKELINNFVN